MHKDFPQAEEFNPYYNHYINLAISSKSILENLQVDLEKHESFISEVTESKGNFAYADGKWTLKEVLLHINDTERIFSYRALCISRGDKISLPGFDQDIYLANADTSERTLEDLKNEFISIRQATITLFASLNDQRLSIMGLANNNAISVRAAAWIMVGHNIHHRQIIQERYL